MGKVREACTARKSLPQFPMQRLMETELQDEFGVNEATIRKWRGHKDRLKKMPKTKKANRGSKAHFPEIQAKLLEWVAEGRKQEISVSSLNMRLQTQIIAKQLGTREFRGSVSWGYKIMLRHDLSIRRRTHIAQKLPEDYEKLTRCQRYIIDLWQKYDYSLSLIKNADQTPLTFDLPAAMTIVPKGGKSVSINTRGNEKNRFTVLLGCTADGGKLPPFVVFKRKTLPKNFKPPKGIHVLVQEKGWMDDPLVRDWVTNVWEKRPGPSLERNLLGRYS